MSTMTKLEVKKIYLKDISFESPASPDVFGRSKIQPKSDVQLAMSHRQIEQTPDHYEAVLKITITSTEGETTLFVAEVQQAGIFSVRQVSAERLELALEVVCPHMLLPFAREALASIVSKGGFPQLLINPINFEAIYRKKQAQQADGVDPAGDLVLN